MAGEVATMGNARIVSVSDGHRDMNPTEAFPASDESVWRAERAELLDGAGMIHPRFGSFELSSGDKWNMSDGNPTFSNARYLVTKTDWDHWTQPEIRADAPHVDAQMLPLESLNVLDLIDGEYDVTDEVKTTPTPGHTPGHVSLTASSGGETAFALVDAARSPAQAHYTDWSPAFDTAPDWARQTRHWVLDAPEEGAAAALTSNAAGVGEAVRHDGGERVIIV